MQEKKRLTRARFRLAVSEVLKENPELLEPCDSFYAAAIIEYDIKEKTMALLAKYYTGEQIGRLERVDIIRDTMSVLIETRIREGKEC